MYNSNILDPIHGVIKVSEIEKWIIGQKPFNRLKRIKQNTFLYLVFPSANHTRFEHSIGVMHLAHQIYLNANENYSTGIFKKSKYRLHNTKGFDFFSVSGDLGEMEELLIQELRIAALLHDVGHGPMSHLFDHYTITGNQFIKIILADTETQKYEANFRNLITNLEDTIEHELVSCLFVIKIINKLKQIDELYETKFNKDQKNVINRLEATRIIQMIEPKFNSNSELNFNNKDYGNFFSSIISSFPLDADRMDYMARDSYFSGVNYGLYDKSRLMMSIIPINQSGTISLAIKESGIDSVIRFIQSRTHLYNQVYFHKTNRAANTMLDFACQKIAKAQPINEAKDYTEFENFYWKNSDEIFLWDTLKSKVTTQLESNVLTELLERNLVKRIFQYKIILLNKTKAELSELNSNLNTLIKDFKTTVREMEDLVLIDSFPNKVFKDVEKSKIKIIAKEDDEYSVHVDWKNFNKELQILEHEVIMFRVYLRGKFKSREIFNEKKKSILSVLKPLINKLREY